MAKNWYIIHTYSGFEKKVAETLRSRIEAEALRDKFGEIMIPTEEVIEMRKGKKVVAPKLFYPGYVLVEMEMSNDTWHLVRSTPRVTGFLGSGPTPVPLTPDDVDRILHRVEVAAEHPKPKLKFDKGETVKITEGPFKDFTGTVDEINEDRSTLRVMVTIFGRATPVELDFYQVEKL
ncbi:MAG: transcription termination/antitermination protein NusG [Acidobacteria bacterium]|nr:MAG: transcription termination/antitermination protein NusG [Acidobacteriota bacterium]